MSNPEVLWAQRSSNTDEEKNFIYLTIVVPDSPPEKFKLDLKPAGLKLKAHSDTLKRDFELELEFFDEIDPDNSKINHTSRNVELKEEYWPRLLKESKKLQFLKTDFDKWVDEDEQNEAPEDDFSQFGGMGGMPGGGMGGGDFGGIDFSKLGGGAAPGEEEEGDDDDDDEDSEDDMPALEGEDDKAGKKAAA